MIQKIKQWLKTRRSESLPTDKPELYTRRQVELIVDDAVSAAYNDGKRDGLAIAREQATKSLKEILWQQNKQNKTK